MVAFLDSVGLILIRATSRVLGVSGVRIDAGHA